jgi:hypothetical protein
MGEVGLGSRDGSAAGVDDRPGLHAAGHQHAMNAQGAELARRLEHVCACHAPAGGDSSDVSDTTPGKVFLDERFQPL